MPCYARLSGFAIAHEALPRTQLGKIRRHLLPALYAAAQRHEPAAAQAELSVEDRALLEAPPRPPSGAGCSSDIPSRALGARYDPAARSRHQFAGLGRAHPGARARSRHRFARSKRSRASSPCAICCVRPSRRSRPKAKPPRRGVACRFEHLAAAAACARASRSCGWRCAGRSSSRSKGSRACRREGPMLICPNHVSYLDPFAVGMALLPIGLSRADLLGRMGRHRSSTTRARRFFSRVAQVVPVDPDRAAAPGLALPAGGVRAAAGAGVVSRRRPRSATGGCRRSCPGSARWWSGTRCRSSRSISREASRLGRSGGVGRGPIRSPCASVIRFCPTRFRPIRPAGTATRRLPPRCRRPLPHLPAKRITDFAGGGRSS